MADRVEEAVARAPSIFFLDELDSYPRRDGGDRHGSRYSANVVNALLTDLTRLANASGVIVVGATNHPDRVDPAITRSGRFDRHLAMGLPDRAGVEAILRAHLGPRLGAADPGPAVDRATDLALKAETEWALGSALLLHAPIPRATRHALPPSFRRRIADRLRQADLEARAIVGSHRGVVSHVADALLLERELDTGRLADLTASLHETDTERLRLVTTLH